MADVALSAHQHRPTPSFSSMAPAATSVGGPQIEMMPNPQFSFPMLPPPSSSHDIPRMAPNFNKRPASMHSNTLPLHAVPIAHRRAKSTAPLPTFAFNAADTTGRQDNSTPPLTPEESVALTPSRHMGHRRGTSELVGGDTVKGVISSSPTKTSTFQYPAASPSLSAGKPLHNHRRSAASGDVTFMQQAPNGGSRTSASLPTTPMDHPVQAPPLHRAASGPNAADFSDPFGPPLDEEEVARPPSRRVVGFSDKVDYIPRPLSTISSETESSFSTLQGHTVNNSISSVMDLSSPSPSSGRNPRASLSTMFEDPVKPRPRSSLEVSKRIEKEGEWLRSSSSTQSMKRPLSEYAAPQSLFFSLPEAPSKTQNVHNKRQSLSHALGLNRRRSEPVILSQAGDRTRMSAVSLHGEASDSYSTSAGDGARTLDLKSSKKKIKDWAVSKIGKRTGDAKRSTSQSSATIIVRPRSADEASVSGKVPCGEPAAAETNLDAVFDNQIDNGESRRLGTPPQPRIEVSTPTPSHASSFLSQDMEDTSPVLDLDAALGPFKTPAFPGQKQRRELHSSRLAKDFGGPGMNYHRRAESAPELPPFGFSRGSMASVSSLPDVFEGEGEEDIDDAQSARPGSPRWTQDEEAGVGIQVVDADSVTPGGAAFNWGADDGLGIHRGIWEPERPTTSYGPSPRLSTPLLEHRRSSSIMEETIPEETSPVESLEVVEAHEEPRTSSVTKSSDSSETPTLLARETDMTTLPDHTQSLMTPDTYHTSNFSSPDFGRRQSSFDTSRLGTSASSIADNRTMSSCTDQPHDVRISTDDVPSLTSSRSTMMSNTHANASKREFSNTSSDRTPSVASDRCDPAVSIGRRSKRASIQSLSQLVGNSFSGKSKAITDESRPHTAADPTRMRSPKKEHRLKKLMFWRTKSKQSLHTTS
ncbi:hypothetical protein LTR08_001351 [Meristemomyces frigidus]|nr:hypothetical protein LTR08_001351 [Meristemomyces frigidus]